MRNFRRTQNTNTAMVLMLFRKGRKKESSILLITYMLYGATLNWGSCHRPYFYELLE